MATMQSSTLGIIDGCCLAEGRVIAVRQAGMSFDSTFNIGSNTLRTCLHKYSELCAAVDRDRMRLVEWLYSSVPKTTACDRGVLLKLKRAIFNNRPVPQSDFASFAPEVRQAVVDYLKKKDLPKQLIDQASPDVIAELRSNLASLAQDSEFRLAVTYSCPWLLSAYQKSPGPSSKEFSEAERSLYAYAVKYISKANPFFTFASIAFPNEQPPGDGRNCEIVLDFDLILSIEQQLLSAGPDARRRLVYVAPHAKIEGRVTFLTNTKSTIRTVTVNTNDFFDALLDWNNHSIHRSFADCCNYLVSRFNELDKDTVAKNLQKLVEKGIVIEYLVKNPDYFYDDLARFDTATDTVLSSLRQYHLKCFSKAMVPQAHHELSTLREIYTRSIRNIYYVNVYETASSPIGTEDAARVISDLKLLKPFFLPFANFARRAILIRSHIKEQIMASPGAQVPYLQLVLAFLRNAPEIIKKHENKIHTSPMNDDGNASWRERLAATEGHITHRDLEELLPQPPPASWQDRSVCFNGPFDYKNKVFFTTNIFAGNGRYLSRYLLHRNARRYLPPAEGQELDVQLIAGYKGNRGYVAVEFPVGCGFDGRYRHIFEKWVDPSDIVVTIEEGEVVYRWMVTGQQLRFHFIEFILAENLDARYELLLADHADCYDNPFFRRQPAEPCLENTDDRLQFVAGLMYGSVCLRRDEWLAPVDQLRRSQTKKDILYSTAQIREWLRTSTGIGSDTWYFRTTQGQHKPCFLDLCNPLSVQTLLKIAHSAPRGAFVCFSVMQPSPESLQCNPFDGRVTELMVEL